MRNVFKRTVALAVCGIAIAGGTACGAREFVQSIDSSKKQIYVNVYNGGNGCDWIKKLAKDFNVLYDESGYEVVIIDNLKYSITDIISDITTGTETAVYYTVEPGIKDMIAQELLEDISDVYDMKVDGEDGKTIGEKMNDIDLCKQVFSGKQGQGLYGIPYSVSFLGLVYEHERFLENNWYFYADGSDEAVKTALDEQKITYTVNAKNEIYFEGSENETNYSDGDRILSCGKDGKYGTYDDGQPTTEAEWRVLLNKIVSKGGYPLLWSGANPNYIDDIVTSIYAQYDGLDNYKLFSSYDGTYVAPATGESTLITPETGYKIFEVSEGLRKGVDFVDTYFTNIEKYIHPFATYTSTSHRDAQDKFVFGFKNEGEIYLTGMLADGTWWENEAKASFNSLVASGETDRGYGAKEYRYMLLPAIENQKGIDGKGNGSVFSVRDSGAVIVKKNSDRELVEWAKKFVAYTTSDESLRYFTRTTGVVRPYDYEISAEELAEMTPFQRNVWTMYRDKENIALVKPYMNNNTCSINFASGKSKWIYVTTYEGASYLSPLSVLQKTDTDGYLAALRNTYTKAVWENFYNVAMAQWGGIY